MKPIKDLFIKKNNIRHKVTFFTTILLICLMIGYASFFFITLEFSKNFNAMFNQSIHLKSIDNRMSMFESDLETYLNTKDSDSFIAYLDSFNELESQKKLLNQGLSYNDNQLLINNISNIMDEYLTLSQKAIEYKRARNTKKYIETFNDVERLSGYIDEIMNQINTIEFSENLQDYVLLSSRIENLKIVFVMITIAIIMLSIVFIYDFTYKITVPIKALSEYAKEISKGNYNIEVKSESYYQEADVLINTFSDMALSIKEYIAELKGKVETENKLRIAEIENLKIQNLLKNAELIALQSQINPHFLFNTLNAGVQLANLEDADKTSEFLINLSSMLRYNIQSLKNTVTLKEELENVKSYYHLMKVRFDDQLVFNFDIDDSAGDIMMPPLILQPIIENSLIHGFEDKEEVGIIDIQVKETKKGVEIIIKDNGKGIEEVKLNKLNSLEYDIYGEEKEHQGHSTGLGLSNVYQRLKNFYNSKDVIFIESELSKYTEIKINLIKNEVTHV